MRAGDAGGIGETVDSPTTPDRTAAGSKEIPSFAFQLADAYLHSCTVKRRDALPDDPEQPTFATSLETHDREEGDGFIAQLSVAVAFRFRAEASCVIEMSTTGVFLKTGQIEAADEHQFRVADCAVILWPYARALVGELVRMTGLQLPPLPTVDVRQTLQSLSPSDADEHDAG